MKTTSQYTKFIVNIPKKKFQQDIYKNIADEVDKEYRDKLGGKNNFAPKVVEALIENMTNSRYINEFLNALIGIKFTIVHSPMVAENIKHYQISFVLDNEFINDVTVKQLEDKCREEGFELRHF